MPGPLSHSVSAAPKRNDESNWPGDRSLAPREHYRLQVGRRPNRSLHLHPNHLGPSDQYLLRSKCYQYPCANALIESRYRQPPTPGRAASAVACPPSHAELLPPCLYSALDLSIGVLHQLICQSTLRVMHAQTAKALLFPHLPREGALCVNCFVISSV